MRLDGKVALITGAATGIGAATALRFAREGALVAVNDVSALEEVTERLREEFPEFLAVAGDVTQHAQVERMVREVTEAFGRVDILVNTAGITRDAMAAKMTEEQGTFLCAQAVLPGMRERGWGRVINTSSVGAPGNIGPANSEASKAGVIGLTKTLALEYAKYGVTVNCVAPGAVMTRMLAAVPDPIKERIVAQIPVGRIAEPDDIAKVHVFLASDDAAFITGQVIFADGGMSVGMAEGGHA